MKINRKTGELTAIGAIAGGGILLFWNTFSFLPSALPGYPGDAFFPRIILIFVLACSVAAATEITTRPSRKHDEERDGVEIGTAGFFIVVGAVVVYVIMLPYVGFEIVTFTFVSALLAPTLIGSRTIALAKSAGIAVITVLVLYFCFVILLDVDFPLLFLPRYIHI